MYMWELGVELGIMLASDEMWSRVKCIMLNLKDLTSVLKATLTENNVSGESNKKHHYRKASRSSVMTQELCTFSDWKIVPIII